MGETSSWEKFQSIFAESLFAVMQGAPIPPPTNLNTAMVSTLTACITEYIQGEGELQKALARIVEHARNPTDPMLSDLGFVERTALMSFAKTLAITREKVETTRAAETPRAFTAIP